MLGLNGMLSADSDKKMMIKNTERRLFFKHIFSSACDFLNKVVSPDHTDHAPGYESGMTSDIMGDLTPELMAKEARRLGLDPKKDQHRVHQSIQADMGMPGIKDNRM